MKRGFTIAETLITLGIIGVVAAITIPNLINKCRSLVLKNQFKKSIATTNQLIRRAKAETGIDTLSSYCTEYKNGKYTNKAECENDISNIIPLLLKTNNSSSTFRYTAKTYNGKKTINLSSYIGGLAYSCISTPNIRKDGSAICFDVNELRFNIVIDINGYSKPNRLGQDIFYFYLDKNDNLACDKPTNYTDEELEKFKDNELSYNRAGHPCNLDSTQGANGIGCGYYALQDKCPYNPGKNYFDCLPK